jgi:hypothetical protein
MGGTGAGSGSEKLSLGKTTPEIAQSTHHFRNIYA